MTAVTLNHVDKVFSFTSKVRFYGASFPGREEGICSKSVGNVLMYFIKFYFIVQRRLARTTKFHQGTHVPGRIMTSLF